MFTVKRFVAGGGGGVTFTHLQKTVLKTAEKSPHKCFFFFFFFTVVGGTVGGGGGAAIFCLFVSKLHLKLPWGVEGEGMMLRGGAPRWQIKEIKGGYRPDLRASTTRHTHPTCMSRVALLQVLVVAGALG